MVRDLYKDPAIIEVLGVDGSEWAVSGYGDGAQGVILDQGAQGLQEAPRKGVWTQTAFQHGSTYTGHSVEPLDLVLGFQIWGDDHDWAQVSSDFRNAFDYEREATIRVTSESGRRTLKVRLLEAPKRDQNKDPRMLQYSLEVYTLRAAWPFWEGDTVTQGGAITLRPKGDLAADYPVGTVERTNLDRMFTLNPEAQYWEVASVKAFNPTDVPIYPVWALTDQATWCVPDKSFTDSSETDRSIITPTLGVGEGLSIDTYPLREPYVAANGSNIAGRFGGVLFLNPIPPRTKETIIALSVVTRQNTVKPEWAMRMVQYWNGPWGGEMRGF